MGTKKPRIVLFHALRASEEPARQAMETGWPEARYDNLIDDSLTSDLIEAGGVSDNIVSRFLALGRYAASTGADGILFTCSAFGPALMKVQEDLSIPALRPNEAAFEAALDCGDRIGLLVTFDRAYETMKDELEDMAKARGRTVTVVKGLAVGALAALQAGRGEEHDRLVAEAAKALESVDALILGQFTLARARQQVEAVVDVPVFTTPEAAVRKLRHLIENI